VAAGAAAAVRVTVYGLGHLGTVTAAGAARAGHEVTGFDPDEARVHALGAGRSGLLEEGLDERLAEGLASGRLRFTSSGEEALRGSEVLWVAFDTPVDDDDQGDVGWLRARLDALAGLIPAGTLVVLSSQVPVGFLAGLEKRWAGHGLHFACVPENLRRGEAVRTFEEAGRLVVGLRDARDRARVALLLEPLGARLEWMSPESAEMTKHALNAWLATSVAFVNEAARLCQSGGADVGDVLRGLRSDPRIGDRPYFSPGVPFSGGTLSRDLRYLANLAAERGADAPLAAAVLESNAAHGRWTLDAVRGSLAGVRAPAVALLGLSGKVGTDALHHSAPLQLALALEGHGVRVRAHDPALRALPPAVAGRITLVPAVADALAGADTAVLATAWPEYDRLGADDFVRAMRRPCVVDPAGRFGRALSGDGRVDYRVPGQPPLGVWGRSREAAGSPQCGAPGVPPGAHSTKVLDCRAAIVTGGSRGLGRAIAGALLDAGASVLVAARGPDTLDEAARALAPRVRDGRRLLTVAADVSTPEGCARVMEAARPLEAELDALVCNAGVFGAVGRLEDTHWDAWVQAIQVNVIGTALMCRAVVPALRRRGHGKIVCVSGASTGGGPLPRLTGYSASKAAVVRFAETLASELAGAHVDVNALAPGILHTQMLDDMLAQGPERTGADFHARLARAAEEGGTPLDKGAALAVFLCSPRSDGITGRLLSAVWDDWAALEGRARELEGSDLYTLRRVTPPAGGAR